MPPRERISKEYILNTAFTMTRENGFESVSARGLAQRMECSTQPIFRVYENMDMLKEDLFVMSTEFFSDYMVNHKKRGEPNYLSMGMAYIELAKREPHLFKLIADIEQYSKDDKREFLQKDPDKMLSSLPDTEGLDPEQKRELFLMVWMFTHGVATLVTSGRVHLKDKEIVTLIKKAYMGFLEQV